MIDDHLIEIKTSLYQTTTLSNLCQTLIYGHLVEKKDLPVNRLSIFNPLLGTMTTFNTKEFNFKKFILTVYKG